MVTMMISVRYAAGFFDGEGSITMQFVRVSAGTRYFRMVVQVCVTDPAPLLKLQERWGGRINTWQSKDPTSKRKRAYYWRLSGNHARKFIKDVRPYLIIKGPAADVALEFWGRVRPRGKWPRKRLSPEEVAARMVLINKLRSLNVKGRTEHLKPVPLSTLDPT